MQIAVNFTERKYKLPHIEFKKFGGDVRDWLLFWAQFKKIDEDNEIPDEDKFQYLLLAILPNTRARELVESYPPTAENYPKVVECLKSRFGREDLLVEVYVRELLKLVLNNASSSQDRNNIVRLYDKIETQLNALDTLGVKTDTCAAMLYPLVESCLPEELLRVWQRSTSYNRQSETVRNRLDQLMSFLKSEVEGEERIALAVSGFNLNSSNSTKGTKPTKLPASKSTAVTGLISHQTVQCVFCGGPHEFDRCFKTHKMSYEEKKKALIQRKACFRCAKIGHSSRRCRERLCCAVCGKSHVVPLCPELNLKEERSDQPETRENDTVGAMSSFSGTMVFLQTLRVKLRGDRGERTVRAIIDTGSQRSYLLQSTAQDMGYSATRTEPIIHTLFGGYQTTSELHHCFEARLASLDGKYTCRFEVLEQKTICNDVTPLLPGPWSEELRKLRIKPTDVETGGPIELLIGADVAGKLFTGKKHQLKCGLVALQTRFGWVVMGRVPGRVKNNTTMTVTSMFSKDASLEELWKLDVLGIEEPSSKKSKSEVEREVKNLFLQTIKSDSQGRYEVSLPWREGHPPLPSNLELARRRLDATVRKLESTGCLDHYERVFDEWLAEDVIEEVIEQRVPEAVSYLPHRPVIKENSTTRIRPVFDASAKNKNSPSLNDCLEKGGNLIELIPSLLLEFRKNQIGVTADIKKAFLQIGLNERDRDCLRFLWKTREGVEKTYRHRRVVFGINASPFLLGATIEFHLHQELQDENSPYSKQLIEKLSKSFYVDNCIASVPDEESLRRFMRESTELMAAAKFDLRGWESNGSCGSDSETIPLLGLAWNKSADTLSLHNHIRPEPNRKLTKRVILSVAQRIFDPIGFACPVILCPKLLLRTAWEAKVGWDEELGEDIRMQFERWEEELQYLKQIEIPRWIQYSEENDTSLHVFCDASGLAYATVIFLRVRLPEGVRLHLLQAKSRIAPLKGLSIPRLELLAASIGARLCSSVRKTLDPAIKCYFWSDSMTVLSWIRREDQWATFVWNRIQEIRELSRKESWRYVPTSMNPADLASRGCSPKKLLNGSWWKGPSWLCEPPETWPREETAVDEEEICRERKRSVVVASLNLEIPPFYSYFSKFEKIVRMIGWIYRFKTNCSGHDVKKRGELTANELERAEKKLVWLIQKENFTENDGRLLTLETYKDEENLIRLKTRITERDDQPVFLSPYVLPAKHPVVKRLIHDTHVSSCHTGVQGTLSILRERFWVLGGRRSVRSVIKDCKACQRYQAKRFNERTPALPSDRVRDAGTFEVSGVDCAGPIVLKSGKKAWICLFTCAVYRAVHLELICSLSTAEFIDALRRFIARRGRPRVMYSDNGTNFRGTENLFNELDWNEISRYSSARRIQWKFNPPSAPWWGGWWERLIGILKRLLNRTLGQASLKQNELQTILCDCEAVVNSRPITHVSGDSNDLAPLTPAMFLRDLVEHGVPDCDAIDSGKLTRRHQYLQQLREALRGRFRAEYIGQLAGVSRSVGEPRSVSVGDIVLVGSDVANRVDWPLGRVIELIPGKDGKTRLARVKLNHGLLLRPIQRLFLLEASVESPSNESFPVSDSEQLEDLHLADTPINDSPLVNESGRTRSGREIVIPKRFR